MTYGDYYSSYMGYKTSQSDKSQEYSTDYTWYDFFANTAVSTIKETKALLEDADANGFTYDNADADYDEFIGKIKDAANEADTSYSTSPFLRGLGAYPFAKAPLRLLCGHGLRSVWLLSFCRIPLF